MKRVNGIDLLIFDVSRFSGSLFNLLISKMEELLRVLYVYTVIKSASRNLLAGL